MQSILYDDTKDISAVYVLLAARYILSALFVLDAVITSWQITLFDSSMIETGLSLRINATFFSSAHYLSSNS